MFIVNYPIGVLGEYMCFRALATKIEAMAPADRPYTMVMPNAYNFSFDFIWFGRYAMAVAYCLFFPPLYMFLMSQRAKFYRPEPKSQKAE